MAEKKVTTMVIKVDLGCEKCQKKIKKVLCKIPEIQNQMYDQKANTVTITVVCCFPEKIKKKIYCKGGEVVKCVNILPPPPPPRRRSPPPPPEPVQGIPVPFCLKKCCGECYQWCGGGPCLHGCGSPTPQCKKPCGKPPPPPCKEPCGRPPPPPPCKEPCGKPPPPPPCKEPCGRPPSPCYEPCGSKGFDSCSCGSCSCRSKGYYSCRCEYGYDNNPLLCTIM